MKNHEYKAHREHSVYYPFVDRDEWELAKFLSDNLNQGQITCFLKLSWVGSEAWKLPAYKSAPQLLTFMDALPKGPKWCCTTIQTEGYIMTHPVHLIWYDALEVTQHIFGNPAFTNDMEFDPYKIYDNGEQEFGEWMSTLRAHDIQDQLPHSTTIIPIVLASDKTPVTRQTATTHAWSCVAYMPIPQFVCHPDFASLLQACVWHQCMDIVFQGVKSAAATGTQMVDPVGNLHYSFTPLVAYTADLPEQQLIACISKNASPLCQHVDPWKVQHFQEEAKVLLLSSVQLPFWRDWRFSDPALFLAPDVLHTLHKFFFDHVVKWCKEAVGANELDTCFRSQHKHIGMCHFSQGITHIVQMTGCEHREIQCTIVPTIAGVVDINFICAAQSPTFTLSLISTMNASLQEFHRFKGSITLAEARRGALAIPNIGAILQYTADCTSHQCLTFTQQIVHILDWEDSTCQFDLYAFLCSTNSSLNNLIVNEFNEVIDMDPAFAWIACVTPESLSCFKGPRPVRNHFLKGLLSDDSVAAFHITVSSDLTDKTAIFLTQHYMLPDFSQQLRSLIKRVDGVSSRFQNRLLKVWYKFRLQLHSSLRPLLVMPSQQVQAYPPSDTHHLGNCDIVLLQTQGGDDIIAQVRMIFGLSMRGVGLPPALAQPFIYVQPFEIVVQPWDDPAVFMYHVKRQFVTGPNGTRARAGMIFPLVNVTHAIELIPVYDSISTNRMLQGASRNPSDFFDTLSDLSENWGVLQMYDFLVQICFSCEES
ncbi:uncharacterized protein BJ212DRAFT_1449128 [Suillus subaureus]|uniref:DUF6830 domain-containing protein n=1 Tax=Suillus subaureus TaxID=48587 RepID=A0A9P7J8P3_9AGAM|nr:uncharacterized protein BJ212DRAFT_1449128 [Suillus subaureus]KAG1808279.1 hypothetical protein BJ212DRAFT_1449128 [Suillus subaureus]